jgi:hypothetical protein
MLCPWSNAQDYKRLKFLKIKNKILKIKILDVVQGPYMPVKNVMKKFSPCGLLCDWSLVYVDFF